ncbi:helix-turn-helix transcriptional regulator [Alteraurantiacibacter palmitatis]|uniref:LuxR C-terminal-related transcriptional regulator n=1 Tax=Alteraurantiacibacter palmitatis TaxID=2054628 RepID=A0ABV7EAN0_9SPHN
MPAQDGEVAEEFSRRLTAIDSCENVVPLRDATMSALALLGFSAACFIAPLTRDPRVGRSMTNIGLPWTWEKQYRARLHASDPLPDIALQRLSAFVWPDDLADEKLTKAQKRFFEISAQLGVERGVATACFGPEGRSGFLGAMLAADAPRPDQLTLHRFHAVGQTSFQSYCRMVKRMQDIPQLSNREMEVLHWIGRGKSNSVIAEILGISPSSVDVYVRRIFAKLGVSDRTTASVKAYSLGLIITPDYEKFVAQIEAQDTGRDPLKDAD